VDVMIPVADQALLERLNDSELVEMSINPLASSLYLEFSASAEAIRLELEGVGYVSFSREHNEKARYFIREVVLSGIGIGHSALISSTLSYSEAKYEQAHSFMDLHHTLYHVNVEGEIDIDVIASRYRIKAS
jgi:hypothetical protein